MTTYIVWASDCIWNLLEVGRKDDRLLNKNPECIDFDPFSIFILQTAEAHSYTCMDLYVFATPYRITWDYYFISREHTLPFESWEEPAELEYVCYAHIIFDVFF